jgi:hypothetical protein
LSVRNYRITDSNNKSNIMKSNNNSIQFFIYTPELNSRGLITVSAKMKRKQQKRNMEKKTNEQ